MRKLRESDPNRKRGRGMLLVVFVPGRCALSRPDVVSTGDHVCVSECVPHTLRLQALHPSSLRSVVIVLSGPLVSIR